MREFLAREKILALVPYVSIMNSYVEKQHPADAPPQMFRASEASEGTHRKYLGVRRPPPASFMLLCLCLPLCPCRLAAALQSAIVAAIERPRRPRTPATFAVHHRHQTPLVTITTQGETIASVIVEVMR
jgi:hypothetical protein